MTGVCRIDESQDTEARNIDGCAGGGAGIQKLQKTRGNVEGALPAAFFATPAVEDQTAIIIDVEGLCADRIVGDTGAVNGETLTNPKCIRRRIWHVGENQGADIDLIVVENVGGRGTSGEGRGSSRHA